MKKTIFIFLLLLTFLFLVPPNAQAQAAPSCDESANPTTNIGRAVDINFSKGLVPCGNEVICKTTRFAIGGFVPGVIISCDNPACQNENRPGCRSELVCRCELYHVFILALNVYNFIVKYIATPLAALLVVVGGLLLLVSGGNPNLAGTAKSILWVAVIGILLIFGSWVIINVVMMAIGYGGAWQFFPTP